MIRNLTADSAHYWRNGEQQSCPLGECFFCQSVNKVILACKFTSFSKNITALPLPPLLQAPSSVFRYISHTLSTSQVRIVKLGETSICHLSFVRFCSWKKFQCGLWIRLEYSSSPFPSLPFLHTCMKLTLPITRSSATQISFVYLEQIVPAICHAVKSQFFITLSEALISE